MKKFLCTFFLAFMIFLVSCSKKEDSNDININDEEIKNVLEQFLENEKAYSGKLNYIINDSHESTYDIYYSNSSIGYYVKINNEDNYLLEMNSLFENDNKLNNYYQINNSKYVVKTYNNFYNIFLGLKELDELAPKINFSIAQGDINILYEGIKDKNSNDVKSIKLTFKSNNSLDFNIIIDINFFNDNLNINGYYVNKDNENTKYQFNLNLEIVDNMLYPYEPQNKDLYIFKGDKTGLSSGGDLDDGYNWGQPIQVG